MVGFVDGDLLFCEVVFADEPDDFRQVCGAILDLPAAELAFYKGVPAVAKVEDKVGFQAVAVMIVGQFTAKVLGVS